MEPLTIDRTHILVLNYNGRDLLAECLPSILEAAGGRPVALPGDRRRQRLDRRLARCGCAADGPGVRIVREPNRGLASFNRVLAALDEPVVLLLNNDVKLEPEAVGPLLRVFEEHDDALFSAPLCWTFDGPASTRGCGRGSGRGSGWCRGCAGCRASSVSFDQADLTAAAGPVLAVDRRKFLALGGYDPVYFPGRIEDLDLGFRGWMAGWTGYYDPRSVAYHRGFGTFGPAFGPGDCDSPGDPQQLPVRLEEPGGARGWRPTSAGSPSGWRYWLARGRSRPRAGPARGVAAAGARSAGSRRALAVGQGSWVERQEAFFRQVPVVRTHETRGAALRRSRSRPSHPLEGSGRAGRRCDVVPAPPPGDRRPAARAARAARGRGRARAGPCSSTLLEQA